MAFEQNMAHILHFQFDRLITHCSLFMSNNAREKKHLQTVISSSRTQSTETEGEHNAGDHLLQNPNLSHKFVFSYPTAEMNSSSLCNTNVVLPKLSFIRFCFRIEPRYKTQLSVQERPNNRLYVQEKTKEEMGLHD
jgi:hypothetical protein